MSHLDALENLGYLGEGTLRHDEGVFYLETENGTKVLLDTILSKYTNKEVRLTVVDLEKADYLHEMMATKHDHTKNT